MPPTRTLAVLLTVALGLAACTPTDKAPDAPSGTDGSALSEQGPAFSSSTQITNAFLPLAQGGRWIYEGSKEGKPYLIEDAVTHATRDVEWDGTSIDTMVVRHREWIDSLLVQEALDYYAQDDDGGVWLFGRNVDNFDGGELLDHDGAWLAGVAGAAPELVMPADPRVGQVFSGEDVVGLDVARSHEVLSLTERVITPDGLVGTGLLLSPTSPKAAGEETVLVPDVGEVLAQSTEGTVRLVRQLPQDAESATEVSFSTPAVVDNPYFGVTGVDYRLYLGKDEGEPIRIEVALTGETKTVSWEGGVTKAVVSQFLETSRRDLLEIAVDWFAQDDAGNVWYFGEDVWNYEDGRIADTDGSWIAGPDGPPGLIMPADPALGQRFNPENIPGLVFETVDVQTLDSTYTLPAGKRLEGVLELHETLDDGTEETKGYARGYGNVSVRVPGVETVDIVYALPNDAIDSPLPSELETMLDELRAISTGGGAGDNARRLRRALDTYRARDDAVPPILTEIAQQQFAALDMALNRAARHAVRFAALDLEQTVLDLARLYRTGHPVELDVLDLLARRMLAAVDADDPVMAATAAAVAGGVAERISTRLPRKAMELVRAADAAADHENLTGIAEAASGLRATLT